ncbi:MAG: efflux RND transporter periplasmic adaptor subunit [Candidatus Vogelbacteria bacterium]|nr:efflux RND transporter periplasmic adaptor subunit [Candidatus Vogelbacteria bacterium]
MSKKVIGIFVVVTAIVGGYFIFHKNPTYQFITVHRGPISESVSITGNTLPIKSVSLAFGDSGIISHAYSDLGNNVYAGQILAELNTSDLLAQLHQAEANVDVQKAKLQGIEGGSRPEDIAASQAAVDKAKQDLSNFYSSISDTSIDSYAKANDAVQTEIEQFFSNGETSNPKLTYVTSNSQTETDSDTKRLSVSNSFNKWRGQLEAVDRLDKVSLEAFLQDQINYLSTIRQLLNSLSLTLDAAPALSDTTVSTYKTDLSTALNEVNAAAKNLNVIIQSIASQKITITQLQAELDLKKAGALPSDITQQQAQVEQAGAGVDAIKAKLDNAQIISPISGVITQFDAKVGQLASPSLPLISVMADQGYEVDAGVSETDIGKIVRGDTVTMTLDAFPNETFVGSVFYIAPSETNAQGVVTYQIKISFNKFDPRLKSGLTANIHIETSHKNSVLILPQYAILQNNEGTFIETLVGNKSTTSPVVLGIQDQSGNVEVVSGVTEGEKVLNIGLKTQ